MNYTKLFTLTAIVGLLFIAGCRTPQISNDDFEFNETSTQPPESQNLPFFIFYPTDDDGISYNIEAETQDTGQQLIDTEIAWDFTIEDIAPNSDYDGENPGLYINLKQGNNILTEAYDISEQQEENWRSQGELEVSRSAIQQIRERCRGAVLQNQEDPSVILEGRVVVNPEQDDLPENTEVDVNYIEEPQVPIAQIGFRDYTQDIEVECPDQEEEGEDIDFRTIPKSPVVEPGQDMREVTFLTEADGVRYQWNVGGETGTGKNFTTDLSPGSYEATLQVTEGTGNEIQTTKTLTVSEEEPGDIQADFRRNPDRPRNLRSDPFVHQNIVYDGSSSVGKNLTYSWNVDGETVGQRSILQHQFEEPGMKEVTLKVQDQFGQISKYTMMENVRQPQNYESGISNVSVKTETSSTGSEKNVLIQAEESMALQSGQIMMFFDGIEYVRNSSSGAIPDYDGLVFENLENDGQWNIAFAGSEDEPLSIEEGETLIKTQFKTDSPGTYEIRMPVEDQYPNTPRGVYTQLTPVGEEDAPRGLPNAELGGSEESDTNASIKIGQEGDGDVTFSGYEFQQEPGTITSFNWIVEGDSETIRETGDVFSTTLQEGEYNVTLTMTAQDNSQIKTEKRFSVNGETNTCRLHNVSIQPNCDEEQCTSGDTVDVFAQYDGKCDADKLTVEILPRKLPGRVDKYTDPCSLATDYDGFNTLTIKKEDATEWSDGTIRAEWEIPTYPSICEGAEISAVGNSAGLSEERQSMSDMQKAQTETLSGGFELAGGPGPISLDMNGPRWVLVKADGTTLAPATFIRDAEKDINLGRATIALKYPSLNAAEEDLKDHSDTLKKYKQISKPTQYPAWRHKDTPNFPEGGLEPTDLLEYPKRLVFDTDIDSFSAKPGDWIVIRSVDEDNNTNTKGIRIATGEADVKVEGNNVQTILDNWYDKETDGVEWVTQFSGDGIVEMRRDKVDDLREKDGISSVEILQGANYETDPKPIKETQNGLEAVLPSRSQYPYLVDNRWSNPTVYAYENNEVQLRVYTNEAPPMKETKYNWSDTGKRCLWDCKYD